ncbi:hypothetical protein Cs7R123_62840 [Catellatospora sp. TT07R-123]|uniref:caspase family protein n=1 Tax=Catellatospora sp. TT07R-123 TaxID=2733863 RepID=UPI001B163641|nr:caspase family protein [Catellatospora sp. TT07R-123]GHJ48942.1 hypothetical protein Cs7R123_62840 [Catellatospora sp. TT07R-123]
MARKALLIGSQVKGLTGVDHDITSMQAALDRWGFDSVRCEAAQATRAGILDACERLIAEARPEDAVFVYYSGHGGYCRPPAKAEPGERPDPAMQFIVPWDFDDSVEGDFRGITSVELSVLFARLTDTTRNVTVALDCCHSAHMSRKELVPRALDRAVSYETVVDHYARLRLQAGRLGRFLPQSNPYTVRLVACAAEQSAYESYNADGVSSGLFTDALTRALTEAHTEGLQVSWGTVVDRVRQQVLSFYSSQRPEAEGPARRLLFDVAETDAVATLPVLVSAGRAELGGAPLLGVRVGDEFTVMPPESTGPDDATKIGDVRVDEVHPLAASGVLELRDPQARVPLGARAYQRRIAAPALPVRLPGTGPAAAPLRARIGALPTLRPAEPGEDSPVEVRADESGALTIVDSIGPLVPPKAPDAVGLNEVVANLQRIAWATGLRRLAADPGHELDIPIDVEFGTVHDGEADPLPAAGGVVYRSQHIYVRVRNGGRERVYVSLLDIGVSSSVSLLNQDTPGGTPVDPGADATFGWNVQRQVLEGWLVDWPRSIVPAAPRPETILVLVTTEPQEIRGLEQSGARELYRLGIVQDGPRSPLDRILDQLANGGSREVMPPEVQTLKYAVRTIDFELMPTAAPVSEQAQFQVDERPEQSTLLWAPRAIAPATVAVRLSDLVVHRNRALGSADIRLDAMVLTRGPDRQPVWSTQTERFAGIRDEQCLPLDKMGIFHGPVLDYLDLAVWVTRDVSGSLSLGDLLEQKLNDSNLQMAMSQAGSLFAAAPQAAMAVAAIGASAVLVNTAYHLLTGIVGQTIGLYRTTLLAHESFGVGRPAEQCRIRAQDFTFSYLVEDVG